MTKTKNSKATVSAASAAGKTSLVTCDHCLHALLIQYDAPRAPLLAECRRKPQPYDDRFPYQMEVARAPKRCSLYTHDARQKPVEVRPKKTLNL